MKKGVLVAVLSALVIGGGGTLVSAMTASAQQEVIATESLTHSHVGSESSNSGCYTVNKLCGGSLSQKSSVTRCNRTCYAYTYQICSKCQEGYLYCAQNPTCSRGGSHNVTTYWEAKCSTHGVVKNSTSSFSSAVCQAQTGSSSWWECGKCGTHYSGSGSCTKVVGYSLGCGLDSSVAIGEFILTKSREGSNYQLVPSVSTSSSVCVPVSYTWSNGDTGTCTVTGDGSYTCTLKWTDMGVEKTATLSYVVEDYDTEPPVIESVTGYESREKYHTIVVSATDNYGVTGYMIEKK